MQFPRVKELVDLRTTYETAKAAYEEQKAALVAETVTHYLAQEDREHPVAFRNWLKWVYQDRTLEEEVWAALLPHLDTAVFDGWYVLQRNGRDWEMFEASTPRDVAKKMRTLPKQGTDGEITWSALRMAETLPAQP